MSWDPRSDPRSTPVRQWTSSVFSEARSVGPSAALDVWAVISIKAVSIEGTEITVRYVFRPDGFELTAPTWSISDRRVVVQVQRPLSTYSAVLATLQCSNTWLSFGTLPQRTELLARHTSREDDVPML